MSESILIPEGASLDLGCASKPRAGYLGVDMRATDGSDFIFDFSVRIPCPPNWLSRINMHHSLEHISHRKALHVLEECNAALKVCGLIEIIVPHDAFWYHVNLVLYYLKREYNPDKLYASQTFDGDYHRAGFTKSKLRDLLERAGFGAVQVRGMRKREDESPEHQWGRFNLGWWIDNFICASQLYAKAIKI